MKFRAAVVLGVGIVGVIALSMWIARGDRRPAEERPSHRVAPLEESPQSLTASPGDLGDESSTRSQALVEEPGVGERAIEAEPEADAEVQPASGPEHWAEKYKDATYGQLIDAQRELTFAIDDLTKDYYQQRFDSGRYQVDIVKPNEKGGYDLTYLQDDNLRGTVLLPTGEVRTVALPRDEFPDAYAMRDEISWIMDQMDAAEKKRPATRAR